MRIKALFFDVFGTVVDWRSSIVKRASRILSRHHASTDVAMLADLWREAYLPAVDRVRLGGRPWVDLDQIHRENLEQALGRLGVCLPEVALDELTAIWHRLDPWPDSAGALSRLRRSFIVAPVSNAPLRMMVSLSRYGGLSWDVILGAELARTYKPDPRVYRAAVDAMGLNPSDCMMVAAHNLDLDAARAVGLRTAFVLRPTEFGESQVIDLEPGPECDYSASSLEDLADQLIPARQVVRIDDGVHP